MINLLAALSLVGFILCIVMLAGFSIATGVKEGKARHRKRVQAQHLAMQLNPQYRQKVEADRRFYLQTSKLALEQQQLDLQRERQTAELTLKHDQFQFDVWKTRTFVTPETYLVDYEPTNITPLPSLKPNPKDNAVNIVGSNTVQLPPKYDLLDVFKTTAISPEQLFLAKDAHGDNIFCQGNQLHHGAFNAATGRGKTVLERGILTQLLFIQHHVILCDLKFTTITEDNLDYRPIAKKLYDQEPVEIEPGIVVPNLLRKEAQIAKLLHYLAYNEIEKRLDMRARGDYSFKTLDIFVEELLALIKAYPAVADDIVRIIALGRELRVNLFTAAQNFLVRDTNMSGGARENFITAYFLGGDMRSGCQILDMGVKELDEYLRAHNVQLGRGIGMLRNEFVRPEACLVSLGTASNEAVYYLLGRADDFVLPDLPEPPEETTTEPIIETPLHTKARELWNNGAKSDRKLLAAMKAAGHTDMTLYQANQLAKQFRAEEKISA